MTKEVTTDGGTTVVLNESTYNKLKFMTQIVLPAIASLYFGLSQIWGLPGGEEVVGTIALFTVFFGAILGISSRRYHQSDADVDGSMVVVSDPGGMKQVTLELDRDPEDLIGMKKVAFKVRNVEE